MPASIGLASTTQNGLSVEADRVDGKTENFMMHVVDGKEVQRCWHLGVENVKHHRFEHQDKGDKHFIAPVLSSLNA